jgi:hypothetical protein
MKVGLTGSRQLAASTALLEGAAQARITCVIPRITLVDSIDNSGPCILLRQIILGNRYRTHSTEWNSLVNSLGRSNLVSLQLVVFPIQQWLRTKPMRDHAVRLLRLYSATPRYRYTRFVRSKAGLVAFSCRHLVLQNSHADFQLRRHNVQYRSSANCQGYTPYKLQQEMSRGAVHVPQPQPLSSLAFIAACGFRPSDVLCSALPAALQTDSPVSALIT